MNGARSYIRHLTCWRQTACGEDIPAFRPSSPLTVGPKQVKQPFHINKCTSHDLNPQHNKQQNICEGPLAQWQSV